MFNHFVFVLFFLFHKGNPLVLPSSRYRLTLKANDEFHREKLSSITYCLRTHQETTHERSQIKLFHRNFGDELDQKIASLSFPAIASFAVLPISTSITTFWVGRLRNPLALAGQGAASQVHFSVFWVISFLPQVITPLVAKAAGAGDKAAVREHIRDSFFLGTVLGLFGTALLNFLPDRALASVLPAGSAVWPYAKPFLSIRALTFLPAMLSNICFAAIRGSFDAVTPLVVSLVAHLIGVTLAPFIMFGMGLGAVGAAVATSITDLVAFFLYAAYLTKESMIEWRHILKSSPSLVKLRPILVGGMGVLARAGFTHIAFIVATRATQCLDKTGTGAAAHAVCQQMWNLGAVFLSSLGAVASIIVPAERARAGKNASTLTGLRAARLAADRMLHWSLILGIIVTAAQMSCLPLLKVFSPLPEVQRAAMVPAAICAATQIINFPTFIGEGIQQGNQYFSKLAVTTAFASAGMLSCLKAFGHTLTGIWGSFAVFNFIRLLGALWHHYYDGPLASRRISKIASELEAPLTITEV